MRLVLGGVRGSTPAPGPDFVRYGGHTSSVGVLCAADELPRLILDAGTGLIRLGPMFEGAAFRGTILLGHLHWDHTHGLPFFVPGGRPDSEVLLLMPEQGDPEKLLEEVLSPPHFPITPSQLGGAWTFRGLDEGNHEIEGFDVMAREIPHKGGRCFGYRITDDEGTFAYLSDHSPINFGPGPDGMGPYHEAALDLAREVDVLIHDSQYTKADFGPRAHYGHSTVEYAVGLAEAAGARHLLLFHHDPLRTDVQLDSILAGLGPTPMPVTAAVEGAVVEIRSST